MKQVISWLGLCWLSLLLSCRDEVGANPRLPVCVPPPIEQNILGTWQYVSTFGINDYDGTMPKRRGTLTFRADGTLDDPNELFESELYGRRIVSKTYKPRVKYNNGSTYNGEIFQVHQKIASGVSQQIVLFILVVNECNYIKLKLFLSHNAAINVELTRR